MEIFIFFNFLYDNDLTVCWGNDNSLGITLEAANGALEEVDKNQIYANAYSGKKIKGNLVGNKVAKESADGQKKNGTNHQGSGTFVM
jgi:hypothetical protein